MKNPVLPVNRRASLIIMHSSEEFALLKVRYGLCCHPSRIITTTRFETFLFRNHSMTSGDTHTRFSINYHYLHQYMLANFEKTT